MKLLPAEGGIRMLLHNGAGNSRCCVLSVTCVVIIVQYLAVSTVIHAAAVCPQVCTCSPDGKDAVCQGVGLEEVPRDLPGHLRTLSLQNNKITTAAISGHLDRFPALNKVDLSFNYIREINSKMFTGLPELQVMNLTHNRIASTEPFALSNNTNLEKLDLSHNLLQQIDSNIGNLTHLKLLNLSSNNIHYIDSSTFRNFLELRTLDLSFNQLTFLNENAFTGLALLEELFLQWNNLVNSLDSVMDWAGSLTYVQHIDLSHNFIVTQENRSESNFQMLQYLDLSYNDIAALKTHMFIDLPQLRVLNLGKNPIEYISTSVFQNVPNLEVLYLDNCTSLTRIPESLFWPLTSIQFINLSHNQLLGFLPVSAFQALPHLQVLDISHNNLTSLPQATIRDNNNLKELYLGDNPFACDCSFSWVKQLTQMNTIVKNLDSVKCVHLANNSVDVVTDIVENDLPCSGPMLMSNDTDIYQPIGSSVLLSCDVHSLPASVITWVTPRHLSLVYYNHHPKAVDHLPSTEDVHVGGSFHTNHPWHNSSVYMSNTDEPDRIVLLDDGSLYIDYLQRHDAGAYKCIVDHPAGNFTHVIMLRLDFSIIREVKLMSIIVGIATSVAFFAIAMVIWGIKVATNRCINQRKRQAIKNIIDNIDAYKTHHIGRIKELGASQMGKFRDQYHSQLDRLRENYNQQMIRIRENCAQQMDKIRDNYATHVGRLKDYSSNRLERLRDNYNTQMIRIREYGSLQLERLRENYKLQQQHLIKILETMNFESCKTVIETDCVRAESMLFDSEVLIEPIGNLPYLLETDPPSSARDSGSEEDYVTASSNSDTASNIIDPETIIHDDVSKQPDTFEPNAMQLLPGLVIHMPPQFSPKKGVRIDELILPPPPILELPPMPRLTDSDMNSDTENTPREHHKRPHRKKHKGKHRPKKEASTTVVEVETLLSEERESGTSSAPGNNIQPGSAYIVTDMEEIPAPTQQICDLTDLDDSDFTGSDPNRESIV